jgi:hypothetical protein
MENIPLPNKARIPVLGSTQCLSLDGNKRAIGFDEVDERR